MRPDEFVAGCRYRNRNGWYEVLQIKGNDLVVRYETGKEMQFDAETQARIISNIGIEERSVIPSNLSSTEMQTFGWTLGVIACQGELQAEIPPQSWRGFCHDYVSATGVCDIEKVEGLYRLTKGGHNKWGCELRIYLPENVVEQQRFCLPSDVALASCPHEGKVRVNNNKFWWHLVQRLGFVCGGKQDIRKIRKRLPAELHVSFDNGMKCCFAP